MMGMEWSAAFGLLGSGLGGGLAVLAVAIGISKIGSATMEGIAKQPEAAGRMFTPMIITAAMIEGVGLFVGAICFMIQSGVFETMTK
jgi:F-type H+-transporting ATPase subunit c